MNIKVKTENGIYVIMVGEKNYLIDPMKSKKEILSFKETLTIGKPMALCLKSNSVEGIDYIRTSNVVSVGD